MDADAKRALQAFAQRRWDLLARGKRQFVAERYRSHGAAASWARAQQLLRRWRALHPDGPLPRMRSDDLEAHVALKAKLDRAADGFRR